MVKIIFIRHGETVWNVEGRCQGQTDIDLTEHGLLQGEILAHRLKNRTVDCIITSDLKRAFQTACLIGKVCGKEVISEPLLREYSFGIWEGLTTKDIESKYSELFKRRQTDPNIEIPQAERYDELVARAKNFVEKCIANHPNGTVVAVTHSVFIKAVLQHYLQLPWSVVKKQMYLGNCSLTVLKCGEKIVVETINDTAHFEFADGKNMVEARH